MTYRVVFLGTPQFAIPSLRMLSNDDRFDVCLVVSQPDRRSGRGRNLTQPPVAAFAVEAGIPLHQPDSLRDPVDVAVLEAVRPDLLVVVAYGEILRRNVLQLAPGGAINVHPSLLPLYRGAAPIPEAIKQGDDLTGVSIMKLVRRLDAGPILAQVNEDIKPSDTTATLGARLASVAAVILPDVAADWLDGKITAVDQDESSATVTREWTKDDAEIDWSRPAIEIERLVRAALPWPIAWTTVDGQRLLVRQAALADRDAGRPGTVDAFGQRLFVATGNGRLELLVVQPQGRKEMPAISWWNGLREFPTFLGSH